MNRSEHAVPYPLLLPVLPALILVGSYGCGHTATDAANPPERARNPVIWADVPDPAVVRVGDTYYMSSTTMHMSPGLPIMKSNDLVNWEMASYAYDTLGDNDALTLRNGESAYGRGSWASSLRYHDGTFYVSTFSATTGRTYIYTTQDPDTGPWKETSFEPSLHDSSLFFDDDGRIYMLWGGGDLRLTELTADASGIEPGGFDEVVIENASAPAGENIGLPAEGSHLLKVDGMYYLMNITWPRGGMRTQVVHRAEKLTGPWEGRVALADRGIAQGGLIDTPEGDWYAMLFQDHGAVGRIPFVVPVTWEDGWPVLGEDGVVPATLDIPAGGHDEPGVSGIVASDEFEREPGDPTLPLAWQWNHNPDDAHWSLLENPGRLRLTTGRVDEEVVDARNTLTQRTFGPISSATTAIDVAGMKAGDYAGLLALQQRYGLVGVKMDGPEKAVVMTLVRDGEPVEVETVPTTADRVYLRIDGDFREVGHRDWADTAYFYYSLDGERWTPIGDPLEMEYTLPHFMGYRFGLFNFATREVGGFVDFDYFRISDQAQFAEASVASSELL
jgi:beta-xylosidase